MNKVGLRQRITSAKSADEVEKLLTEGKTYEFAQVKTQRTWKRAAARILATLKGEVYKAPAPVEQEETTAPKKKRGIKKKLEKAIA